MLIMAVLEFIVTIWSAVLCCRAVCRCCKTTSASHTIQFKSVVYAQQPVSAQPAMPAMTVPAQGPYTVCKYLLVPLYNTV